MLGTMENWTWHVMEQIVVEHVGGTFLKLLISICRFIIQVGLQGLYRGSMRKIRQNNDTIVLHVWGNYWLMNGFNLFEIVN